MKDNIDIFSSASPQSGEWFRFKEIGDSIQGTYIDVRNGTDSFGNQQTIYVLQDANGKIWNLGFRQTATVIHERMKGIRLGQIVGFRFDEHRESKRNPGTKVKIIRIYADSKLVDHEWLAQRKEIESHYSDPGEAVPQDLNYGYDDEQGEDFTVPEDASPVDGAVTESKVQVQENEALKAIRDLAKAKGLTNDTMSDEEADKAIEQFTGLSLTEENLTKIIVALTGYSKA